MRRAGKVVRQVLDVSVGTLLPADGPLRDARVAMVKDRVTTVTGQAGGPSPDLLREVA